MRPPRKTPGEVSPYDKIISRKVRVEIGPIEATAMILGQVIMAAKTHGLNGGSYMDQVKVLMKKEWDLHKRYEFTIKELLDLWNYNTTAKDHTRAQVVSVVQALRANETITVTMGGGKGGSNGRSITKYGLASVINAMVAESPVEKSSEAAPDNPENEQAVQWVGDVILNKISAMNDAIIQALTMGDQNIINYTESFKLLVTELKEQRKVAQENIAIQQSNLDNDNQFYQDTQHNFKELEEYFKKLEEFMVTVRDSISAMQMTSVANRDSNYDGRYWANEIKLAFKEAYKEGYKDGRDAYREEFVTQFKAAKELTPSDPPLTD